MSARRRLAAAHERARRWLGLRKPRYKPRRYFAVINDRGYVVTLIDAPDRSAAHSAASREPGRVVREYASSAERPDVGEHVGQGRYRR